MRHVSLRRLKILLVACCLAVVMLPALCDRERDAAKRKKALEEKGEVKKWADRSWTLAYDYSSRHYKVTSNTSYAVCQYIGTMMEEAYTTYSAVFQFNGSMQQLPINAYAQMDEFREVAATHGFTFRDVSGFYTTADGGAIHLPYQIVSGQHPLTILLHEGAHQFVHEAIDMPVPWRYEKYFDENSRRLASTPIWLNEGLACYFETARYDGDSLELGRVNRQRLMHLQALIKQEQIPALSATIGCEYGQRFDVRHYAVAWGVVWYLRHDSDVSARDDRRRALNRYIERVKLGFFEDPDVDFKTILFESDSEEPRKDVAAAWRAHIGRSAWAAFREDIIGSNDDDALAQWETAWKEWIMHRNPRYAFGGTKRGDAVFNEGNLQLGE